MCLCCLFFFVQAEDGIRDLVRSRGLVDGYKRQLEHCVVNNTMASSPDDLAALKWHFHRAWNAMRDVVILTGGVSVGDHDLVELAAQLSLIHI